MRILLRVVGGLLLAVTFAGSAALFTGSASGADPALGQYIVVLRPGAERAAVVRDARSLGGEVFMEYRHALNAFALRLAENALPGIKRNPNVLFIEPDRDVEADAAPAPCVDLTQCQRISVGVDRIEGDLSSTRSGDGRGAINVNVAVLDSGISPHPDLSIAGGVDCTQNGDGTFNDPAGHGTMVGGFIGALDNGFGRVGVAPGASLFAVRVLKQNGHGNLTEVICGIDWVTGTRTDSALTNDIVVANMSLGIGAPLPQQGGDDGNCGLTNEDALHFAICNSAAAGVTYVVSAGNAAADLKDHFPAAYDEVLTATAMADYDGKPGGLTATPTGCSGLGSDDEGATFSNFATLTSDRDHTISAPGVCIGSTHLNGGYAISSGTSFASPLVAGTVALCIASGPCAGLAPAQIVQKIVADAASYNTARKNFGYGFQGDPLRPISGKYYGYLIRAGLY